MGAILNECSGDGLPGLAIFEMTFPLAKCDLVGVLLYVPVPSEACCSRRLVEHMDE